MMCIKIFAVIAFLTVADAKPSSIIKKYYYDHHNTSLVRNDDYVNANRRQYAANIDYYRMEIENFQESYLDRVFSMEYQKDALVKEITRVDEKLYPLTLLSDFTKMCVNSFKTPIPSVDWVKGQMNWCMVSASNKNASLTSDMETTKRSLERHYDNDFENKISNCEPFSVNGSMPMNYTLCLVDAVSETDAYTLRNQKQFSNELEAAKNFAKNYIKTLQECTFVVHNTTISIISEANTRIEKCIHVTDDYPICGRYFCYDIYRIPAASIDPKNATMPNPFYGRNQTYNCLMLDIV
uniref:Putative secreted protein n=1 Tax=Haematobia irritans TaxID=7368 RepID=A0A1L8EGC3_HAEIR